jgi:hypothetical protein
LFRVWFQEFDNRGRALPEPRVVGVIQQLVPSEVFVPNPGSQLLQTLRRRADDRDGRELIRQPRFAATVQWGRRFEPWLTQVRLLANGVSEAEKANLERLPKVQ